MNSPALLLLVTGLLLGLTFPFARYASEAGIHPVAWAWLLATGAALSLFVTRMLSGSVVRIRRGHIRFYLIASTVSLVFPNILVMLVIPELGSGFTAILYTISPLFTLSLALLGNVRVPDLAGIVGVLVGFAGAAMVAWTRGEVSAPASWLWVLGGLCIPACLAIGNIYRTVAWPVNADPVELACGSNACAAVLLLLVLAITGSLQEITLLASIPVAALLQAILAGALFAAHFNLQLAGGPTYLSQIGYIAAAIALLFGTFLYGERYAAMTWIGGAVIVAGIAITIIASKRAAG